MIENSFFDDFKRINKRRAYYQVLKLAMIISTALMFWKGLIVFTGSESPIMVVVFSDDISPEFRIGDILFLTNDPNGIDNVGDIVAFRTEGREIPIVHRIIKVHRKEDGTVKYLTKGDFNYIDDRSLYAEGHFWLEKKEIVGKARGYVPYIGIVIILMNYYPQLKYVILATLGLFVLFRR